MFGLSAATVWDLMAKAANLAQLSGLHAMLLIVLGATVLRIPQSRRECAELERCARKLRSLLQWPGTGCGLVLLGAPPVGKALGDAAGLVDSYKKSTLWCRVRKGRSTARQLREMQDVNSYSTLVLFINAHLLILQATPTTHQTSDPTRLHEVNGSSESPGVQALTNCSTDTGSLDAQGSFDILQREIVDIQMGNTDPAVNERSVPAIVISVA